GLDRGRVGDTGGGTLGVRAANSLDPGPGDGGHFPRPGGGTAGIRRYAGRAPPRRVLRAFPESLWLTRDLGGRRPDWCRRPVVRVPPPADFARLHRHAAMEPRRVPASVDGPVDRGL